MNFQASLLAMAILIVGWTITPFLKKVPLQKITPISFLLFNHLAVHILLLLFIVYLLATGKFKSIVLEQFNLLNNRECQFIVLVSFIGLASGIAWISLIKNNYVSYIIPHIQPLIITLTIIISYFIVKEPLTRYHFMGVFLVVAGLLLINYGKSRIESQR
tara:strand:+ start:1137 stop:1616 length:480 start_codon:yes stop_codon:yes gene_type:complete